MKKYKKIKVGVDVLGDPQKQNKNTYKYIDGEDGIVISMPEIKKTAMDKVKVFAESPMEEPLLNSREIKINIKEERLWPTRQENLMKTNWKQ